MEIKSRIMHPVFVKNIYGEYLLENIWEDYLDTSRGKVEFLVGIVNGKYQHEDFDADFLGEAVCSWYEYRNEFDVSPDELNAIEKQLVQLNILEEK